LHNASHDEEDPDMAPHPTRNDLASQVKQAYLQADS
jgi:hypothetical protein